ncbi:JUPI2 protein, partial [Polyodon spathula]|nr:JUPI2 protein [Polyodon spathula]
MLVMEKADMDFNLHSPETATLFTFLVNTFLQRRLTDFLTLEMNCQASPSKDFPFHYLASSQDASATNVGERPPSPPATYLMPGLTPPLGQSSPLPPPGAPLCLPLWIFPAACLVEHQHSHGVRCSDSAADAYAFFSMASVILQGLEGQVGSLSPLVKVEPCTKTVTVSPIVGNVPRPASWAPAVCSRDSAVLEAEGADIGLLQEERTNSRKSWHKGRACCGCPFFWRKQFPFPSWSASQGTSVAAAARLAPGTLPSATHAAGASPLAPQSATQPSLGASYEDHLRLHGEGERCLCGDRLSPGGKDSGIFGGVQLSQSPHHPRPPGGKSSHIFRDSVSSSTAPIHPNKPKVGDTLAHVHTRSLALACSLTCHNDCTSASQDTNIFAGKSTEEKATQPSVDEHEPRLGPRPLAHNKVIQPPGGKSSIVFY